MSKHDLKARPILSTTPKTPSTPSLTVVIAALAISKHLNATTGLTVPKIVKTLINLQEVDITLPNGHTQTAHPHIPLPCLVTSSCGFLGVGQWFSA